MADPAGLAEAYHVLAQLLDAHTQNETDLRTLQQKANTVHKDLLAQLEEAQQHGDQAAVDRIMPLLEDAQQAWMLATHELGETNKSLDQTPTPKEDPAHDQDAEGASGRGSQPASDPPAAGGSDRP